MNYYQHHIGDYRRDTAHLSLLEHGVYRQLLDMYYLSEEPIPKETKVVFRRLCAKTEEEKTAIITILNEFFTLQNGYVHKRCSKEITAYKSKADRARSNGKLGGRPSKTEVVISGLQKETDSKANHKPITNNHKPIIKEKREGNFVPPTLEEVKSYCLERNNQVNPETFIDFYCGKGWLVGKNRMKDWKACIRTWEQRGSSNGTHQQDTRSRAKRFADKCDEIARRDIEQNGFTDTLD